MKVEWVYYVRLALELHSSSKEYILRVLAEIDFIKPLPNRVIVTRRKGGQNVKLFMEVLCAKRPPFCKGCGIIGNEILECRRKGNFKQLSLQKGKQHLFMNNYKVQRGNKEQIQRNNIG